MSNSTIINFTHRTLLLFHYQLPRINTVHQRFTSPLADIKIFPPQGYHQLNQHLQAMYYFNEHRKHNHYDRCLVLYSPHSSNARRKRMINMKRSPLLQLISNEGKAERVYTIELSLINEYVPDSQLINHISLALNFKPTNNIKNQSTDLRSTLFPYNHQRWTQIFKSRIQNKKISYNTLNNSYISTELKNLYKLQFSLLPQTIYQDFCDFEKMLAKFNFIKFFTKSSNNNHLISLKYIQRLIKIIKWRTEQTKQYLLLLARNQSPQKFLISIDNFIFTYEKYYKQENDINK